MEEYMKLFTKSQLKKLVENHKQQDGTKSFKAVVKLFNPTGQGTWFLSEYNPDQDIAFGLCHIFEKELGYVDISELKNYKGMFGLGIERDLHFDANKYTLEECKEMINV
tara:strand:- start:521 stop:847 length:327 start_codon:yes stop_codon:yes gene_type:complete